MRYVLGLGDGNDAIFVSGMGMCASVGGGGGGGGAARQHMVHSVIHVDVELLLLRLLAPSRLRARGGEGSAAPRGCALGQRVQHAVSVLELEPHVVVLKPHFGGARDAVPAWAHADKLSVDERGAGFAGTRAQACVRRAPRQ